MLETVATIIREVATTEIVPWWRALESDQILEKAPGEVVTEIDRRAETVLTDRLRAVRDLPVVGEEATAANPRLPDLIDTEPAVWLVDPLDGTSNFVAGSPHFAVMVALVEAGETVAAWVWQPMAGILATAVKGEGTSLDGEPVSAANPGDHPSALSGVLKQRFLPEPAKTRAQQGAQGFAGTNEGSGCAGVEYPDLLRGVHDFILYWRTLPWDHAPGALLAEEAGYRVGRPDGGRYRPGDDTRGLLISHPGNWSAVQAALLGG